MSRQCKLQQGFTFLELVAVVIIIGILASSGLVYYEKALKDARRVGVEILAHRFTAAVALIHGKWIVQGGYAKARAGQVSRVNVENIDVYLNEFGWPANTDGKNTGSRDQTAEECFQIWQAVLQNPPLTFVEGRARAEPGSGDHPLVQGQERYRVSQHSGQVCRYELITEAADAHYFDYNLRTGQVLITVTQ